MAVYCASNGRAPSRRSPPGRWIERSLTWAARLDRIARSELESPAAPSAVLRLDLPVDDELQWQSDAVSITPLRTVGALVEEGERMRNCAARRAAEVLGRRCVVCSATIRGEPHTLEARRTPSGWALAELRGFANAPPVSGALDALEPWIEAHGIDLLESTALASGGDETLEVPF